MSFFGNVDSLVAKFKADLINAKVAAREFGFAKVRMSGTGVWFATRLNREFRERSSAELVATMKEQGKQPPRRKVDETPENFKKRVRALSVRLDGYRFRLESRARETKQQAAERKSQAREARR